MAATMLVAAIVAVVYLALIAARVAVIRRCGPATDGSDPRFAVWLAGAGRRRHERAERAATQALLAGRLNQQASQTAMAAVAALEEAERPFAIPQSRS